MTSRSVSVGTTIAAMVLAAACGTAPSTTPAEKADQPQAAPTPGAAPRQAAAAAAAAAWPKPDKVERDGPDAELLVQVGDIDNLGFGWPDGFDPFSGRSTDPHDYPWAPNSTDAPGTDRILVVSGHRNASGDGYTSATSRDATRPVPLRLAFDRGTTTITSAALQLFVDDFQAPSFGTRYLVTLDGRDAPDLAAVINRLDQTGPIGKLVTLQILPDTLGLLEDGRLEVSIDDPTSDVADGFAFDFVRLLINPKPWRFSGTVRGIAVEASTGDPLAGVLVSAGNVRQMTTGADGRFTLSAVPAGLAMVTGAHPDYLGDTETADLIAGETVEVTLELTRNEETSAALGERLDKAGRIALYGIYFDTGKDTLKPSSNATLEQVRSLLTSRPSLRLVVAGHTDAEGTDAHNQSLSERRAAAVVAWLTAKGIAADRLTPEGFGEAQPVADNARPEGRALNRRVELRDASR